MKILLLNSPIYDYKSTGSEDHLPPFGHGYIATELTSHGFDTNIIDCVQENQTVNEICELINT